MKNVDGEGLQPIPHRTMSMLSAITVTLVISGSLLYSLRGRSGLIARRPYNNRYNAAAAARDGRLEG